MFQTWELLHEVPRYHHSLRGKRWCVQDSLEPGGFSRAPRWVSPLVDPGPLDEAEHEPTGSSAAMPSMSAPSMKEKEEHFVSHFPFRAWCEHCVRGKAKAMKHVRVDHSEEQVPVIPVDYCFMNSKDDTVITEDTQSKHSPVLLVRDRWTRMDFAHVLPYKGVQKGPVGSKCLLNDLRKLGYPKMIVRYDPEPALQAVVEAAKNGFQGQLILEKIPVGVSESKGEIERAVQTIEGQSRHSEVRWRPRMVWRSEMTEGSWWTCRNITQPVSQIWRNEGW